MNAPPAHTRRYPQGKVRRGSGAAKHDPEKFTAKSPPSQFPRRRLVFMFRDGTIRTLTWENRSRRESWTDEMNKPQERRLRKETVKMAKSG
jgi:hypothetical protein